MQEHNYYKRVHINIVRYRIECVKCIQNKISQCNMTIKKNYRSHLITSNRLEKDLYHSLPLPKDLQQFPCIGVVSSRCHLFSNMCVLCTLIIVCKLHRVKLRFPYAHKYMNLHMNIASIDQFINGIHATIIIEEKGVPRRCNEFKIRFGDTKDF